MSTACLGLQGICAAAAAAAIPPLKGLPHALEHYIVVSSLLHLIQSKTALTTTPCLHHSPPGAHTSGSAMCNQQTNRGLGLLGAPLQAN